LHLELAEACKSLQPKLEPGEIMTRSYIPMGNNTSLMTPRATRPRWIAPAIIGFGVLYIVLSLLVVAIVVRGPQESSVPLAGVTPSAPADAPARAPAPGRDPAQKQLLCSAHCALPR
jgi:hypothetical protein